jgi:predicted metal-dependent phosphoesterase TrpH
MQSVYDLHSHTTASDGSLSPTALVEHAAQCGVQVLAVTDHDVTAGLEEAQAAAAANNICLVPGIEISVTWAHQTIHVVGLNIDPACSVLQSGLEKLHTFRAWRAEEIARRLDKAQIPGSLAAAKAFAGGKIISRTHFARFLVAQGYAKDMKQVFRRYLVRNKPGYVPGQWADLDDALNWIHGAGGMAVLAHPARYQISSQRLRQLLAHFRDRGGVGIEVVSGSHSQGDILRFAQLAEHFGFYASRGSDYHGPENAYADPAYLPVLPANCRPIWTHSHWANPCSH